MPKELYEEVKEEIPKHIGVHNGSYCLKNAKKQELSVDEKVLKDSLIRSLCREAEKVYTSEHVNYINRLKRQISTLERENKEWRKDYNNLYKRIRELYGRDWDKSSISFD
jgi:tRNA U55 pseudouridine synthase TruB